MEGVWFKFWNLPVYWLSAFVVLGFLWFGFVVYKKGQEYHYHEESLLDLVVLSGVLSWVLGRVVFVLINWSAFADNWIRTILVTNYPGYHLGGVILGLVLANWIMVRREEIKAFEGLDLLALGLAGAMPWERLGRVFVGEVTVIWQIPIELLQALVFLIIFVWLWRLEKEYRTFAWYRFRQTTARPGFIVGMLGVMLGLVLVLSGFWPKLLIDQLVLGVFSLLVGIGVLFWRSGRKIGGGSFTLPKK